jgi:hypothetical protein
VLLLYIIDHSSLHLQTSGKAGRQNPRKVSDGCIREPFIGDSKSCNIACEVNSRGLSRSYLDKRIMSVDKKELLKSILEKSIASKSYSRSINPIEYHLKQIEWAVFGTITFRDDYMTYDNKASEEARHIVYHRLIGCTCSKLKIKNRNLIAYMKTEWGKGHRGHLNFLIGKDGITPVTPQELSQKMQVFWAGGLYPLGTAVIEPFRKDLHSEGISYQTKLEFDAFGNALNNSEEFSYMLLKRMATNSETDNEMCLSE